MKLSLLPRPTNFINRRQNRWQARCFEQLELDPRRHNNIKRLQGKYKGCLRYRLGNSRVIYQIDDSKKTVCVLTIAHRSEVYE